MGRDYSDDGPKLREERSFEEFYDDLNKETLIQLITPKDDIPGTNQQEASDEKNEMTRNEDRQHIKQMIFNGKVTIEPIRLNRHRGDFKKSKYTIDQLNTEWLYQSKRARKLQEKSEGIHKNFNKNTAAYINKFHGNSGSYELSKNLRITLERITKTHHNFKYTYDMDEQDDLYLQYINHNYCGNKMSHYMFEIVMTVLENEWHHLEKQIPPRSLSSNPSISDHQSQTARIHYELYSSDDGTSDSIEQACAICDGLESSHSNAIVFCDGCDVAVHQECYGIVFIPEGQWLCRLCLVSKNRKVNCLFCPSNTGAFKQTDTGSWAHVVCALWIPELYFANLNYMEPIEGVQNIHKSRWKLNCYICDQKGGACIQCSNKNCFTAYHATCAKRASLYMSFNNIPVNNIAQNQVPSDTIIQSYCDKHSPYGWFDCREGIMKTKRYFTASKQNENETNTFFPSSKKPISGDSIFKNRWKTNRGTPIAPNIFGTIIEQVLINFKIDNANKICFEICKYWSMKRELKRGAPLVRIFDSSSYNMLDISQLQERVEFTEKLLQDLSKLRKLSQLLKRRTVISNELVLVNNSIISYSQYPEKELLKKVVLEKFVKSKPFKYLENHISSEELIPILTRCKHYEFKSSMELKDTMNKFFVQIESDNSTTKLLSNGISKAQELLSLLLRKMEGFNIKECIKSDFILDENDRAIMKRPWKGVILMEQEELSEVEELSSKDERLLRHFLTH